MWQVLSDLVAIGVRPTAHPLADAVAVRQIIADLPKDNASKSLEELTGWLESLTMSEGLPLVRMLEALRHLDEAAVLCLGVISREYHSVLRPVRREEMRLWGICHAYWAALANACEFLLMLVRHQSGQSRRPALAWLTTRLIGALANLYKWKQLHYGPVAPALWQRAGQTLLLAEAHGVASVPTNLPGAITANREYARLMVLHAASLSCLAPAEMDVAEKLVMHFLSRFVISREAEPESVYWADLASSESPQRLARLPKASSASLRFMKPSSAHTVLAELLEGLERGYPLPAEINFGGEIRTCLLLPALRHLVEQLAPNPPLRTAIRHRVRHRMAVLHGLPMAWQVFAWRSSGFAGAPDGESWVVEDVSSGGLGASLAWRENDWLKIGVLVSLNPEGGDNWLLGCVRRCERFPNGSARIGIEVLGRRVRATDFYLRPPVDGQFARAEVVPGLLIFDGNPENEYRVVLPAGAFNQKESFSCLLDGSNYLLTPIQFVEQGGGFVVARYSCKALRARSTCSES